MKADIKAVDRGELVSVMEPLLIGESSRHRAELTDLALDLTQKSAGFRRSLPPSLLASLADLVRAMNCYYSNLIEGHDTHTVDIERAMKNDYSQDARKRDLLEAKARSRDRPMRRGRARLCQFRRLPARLRLLSTKVFSSSDAVFSAISRHPS
jgi:hypothetical protein